MRSALLVALLTLAGCRAPAAKPQEPVPPTNVTAKRTVTGPETVQPAEAAHDPAPEGILVYPELSRRLQEEGTVELRFEVLQSGAVQSLTVARSSGYERLDEAALTAARTWHFNPRTGGGTVEVLLHRVVFRLTD